MESHLAQSLMELPTEIWLDIFEYLNIGDLQQVLLVNQNWMKLSMRAGLKRRSMLNITQSNFHTIVEYMRQADDVDKSYCFKCYGLAIHAIQEDIDVEELQHVLARLGPHARHLRLYSTTVVKHLNKTVEELLPNIVTLDLSPQDNVRIRNLFQFAKLNSLYLNYPNQIGSAFKTTSKLNSINQVRRFGFKYDGYDHDEDMLLETLKTQTQSLKKIVLDLPKIRNYEEWRQLWPQFKRLQAIDISSIHEIREEFFFAMIDNLPSDLQLKHFDVRGFKWNSTLFERILNKWPIKFKTLDCIDYMTMIDLWKWNLSLQLRNLTLDYEGVTDASLACIFKNMKNLRTLILTACSKITDKGLCGNGIPSSSIQSLKGLKELSLCFCGLLTDITLTHTLKFKELRILNLSGNLNFSATGVKVLMSQCPAIEQLMLQRCKKITKATASDITGPRLSIIKI